MMLVVVVTDNHNLNCCSCSLDYTKRKRITDFYDIYIKYFMYIFKYLLNKINKLNLYYITNLIFKYKS